MEKSTSKDFDLVSSIMGCFMFILASLMKPVTAIKNKINDYSDVKTTGILVVVIAFCRMIVNLLGTMISTIFVKERVSFLSSDTKLKVSFEGLKNLDYFNLIVKQFIGFIIVVAAVAGIYYVVAVVMKKTVNYFKLAAIVTVSFVPMFIVSFISIIVAYIYAPLAAFLVFASLIYSLLTLVHCIDEEVKFDDKSFRVYFQTICLTIVFIVVYYILSKSISSMFSFGSLF